MKKLVKTLVTLCILTLLTGRLAFAAPEFSKLTAIPWGLTPNGYPYNLEVIGNVSADEFWVLATTPSAGDPNVAACTLYSSDGTDAGTKKLYELFLGKCGALSKDRVLKDGKWYVGMTKLVSYYGGPLYAPEGEELWVVGASSASEIVINAGTDSSSPGGFYNDGSTVYFAATTKASGRELWTTDGTQASTSLFKDINPGAASSNPTNIVYFNNFRYFAADDGVHGKELWRTSGLPSRVELFKDINIKTGVGSDISALFPFGGLLFISANDGAHSQNLWATTGYPQTLGSTAPNETALFKDLYLNKTLNPRDFFVDSGKLYFLSDSLSPDGSSQTILWQSDGTASGTTTKYTFSGNAKYLGRMGTAGLAFNVAKGAYPLGVILGQTVTDLGVAYYPALVNDSYYFSTDGGYSDNRHGTFRYDPYSIPNLELITNELLPGSSGYLFNRVVATSSTRAVENDTSHTGYYSVVDKTCTSGIKKNPGVCGCSTPDTDSDSDGTPNCNDACPNDGNKIAAGVCGCGKADVDTDKDGALDCQDSCPTDATKTAAGICGCGISDADSDGDGTADCKDQCVSDPKKVAGGTCGCGIADTDRDGDGTADCKDQCPSDAKKTASGICGCGNSDEDSDGDGTPDCNDKCPADNFKTEPKICGCNVLDIDSDEDGVLDCVDKCSQDSQKSTPGICGCGVSDRDSDKDGTADCKDQCPSDGGKVAPGACGCGAADTDTDKDGELDCHDRCPNDGAKTEPGQCGCGALESDKDGDGSPDCKDGCPNDSTKEAAGTCGCGVADTDGDRDGTADCNDQCPGDNRKSSPQECGCGVEEIDSDSDGVPDCKDQCPMDPNKTAPGVCGCWIPDEDVNNDGVVDCVQSAELRNAPPAPIVKDAKASVTVVMPASTTARNATYTVTYRVKTMVKVKGKAKVAWSAPASKPTSSQILTIKKPKSAVGIEASYKVTIPGVGSSAADSPKTYKSF